MGLEVPRRGNAERKPRNMEAHNCKSPDFGLISELETLVKCHCNQISARNPMVRSVSSDSGAGRILQKTEKTNGEHIFLLLIGSICYMGKMNGTGSGNNYAENSKKY